MAYKIQVIPAAQASDYIAEHDGVALAAFVDAAGNPVDIGGGSTAPAAGSVTTDILADAAVTTTKVKDKAITAAKMADGVIPPAPTWTTIAGKPAAAAAIADVAADGTVTPATVNAILAALRSHGIIAAK